VNIRRAAGFALIDVIFVCGIIGIIAAIAMPRLLQAKQAAGAASALGSMRAINSAELTFALTCGSGFYAPNLTTLGTAPAGSNEAFITMSLSGADTITKSGYVLRLQAVPFESAPATCNGLEAGSAGQGFRAGADPVESGNPRYFAVNASGFIYEDSKTLFDTMPELEEPPSGHPLR
jgi:type IV pilus assembly protein PilA